MGDLFSVSVNGVNYSFTAASTSANDVATGLAAAVNADAGMPVTASGATGGAYAEEERRLVRAAAKNVKKKLVRFLAVLAASVWRPVWLCLYVHGYHA